jgi:uncharacterized protein (DUF1697 family)
MAQYISLLRGVNVSGKNKLPMADLRNLLSKSGFTNVQTYIQSGNIVFQFAGTEIEASTLIAQKIKEQYDYDVPVITLSPEKVQKAMDSSPFKIEADQAPNKTFICFLSEKPEKDRLEELKKISYDGEFMKVEEDHIHLYFPNGAGRAKLSNNLIEKKLKVNATTRNWRTMENVLKMV